MAIINKGDKLYGMVHWKCPKCNEGELFSEKLSSVPKSFKMHAKCPVCGQSFILEPGFYWGAMYIDYLLASLIMFSVFAVAYFVFDLNVFPAFGAALLVATLLYVFIYRTGRAIWINAFIKFDPPKDKQ
ncbi:MAG: DUF983 domain-containing protein [Saprospiraceae bacterium]